MARISKVDENSSINKFLIGHIFPEEPIDVCEIAKTRLPESKLIEITGNSFCKIQDFQSELSNESRNQLEKDKTKTPNNVPPEIVAKLSIHAR